ncbi:MAG: beta-lactamase family protein [Bacteroidales bacterium]|nr:beta-lactamase family protein [Bacteroidales bacterium]
MKKHFIFTLLFCLLTISICSQQLNTLKLDSLFQALEDNNRFMGSVALSHKGSIIYSKAIGFADTETGKKASPATIYRIGSISKMFTSVMIFKAVEEKKISLDQNINHYFPEIENADKITISQLLYHRSGIHSFTDDPDYLQWSWEPRTEKELVDKISSAESEFEPGSKMKYSNSNFVLLTFILEKIYNKPYKEILAEKITNQLGLNNTYLGGKTSIAGNECFSYRYDEKWVKERETDMSVPLGAGAVLSTPADLTRFIEKLFGGEIISAESLKEMTTIKDNAGMGIFPTPFYEKKGFGHGGGIDGFRSMLGYFPDDSLAIAITSNGANYNINNITVGVLSCYFGRPYDIPKFNTYHINESELDQYTGVYSSTQIPLKITVKKEGSSLTAQATGQQSFILEPADKNIFRFDIAGIVMEFAPEENKMILKQGGGVFTFSKD